MSDVELGGATVFPLIGARVAPSKVCLFSCAVSAIIRPHPWPHPCRAMQHIGSTWKGLGRGTSEQDMPLAQCWWALNGVSVMITMMQTYTWVGIALYTLIVEEGLGRGLALILAVYCLNISASCNLISTVCNKWIHERGQEFRLPCGLSSDE